MSTLLQGVPGKIPEYIFSQAWHGSLGRRAFMHAVPVYKNPSALPNFFDKGQRD